MHKIHVIPDFGILINQGGCNIYRHQEYFDRAVAQISKGGYVYE